MAITFPASPVNGQTHTENGQIFVFDSTRGYWLLKKQDQIVASTSRSTFVATAGQTVHTVNYDPSASVIVSVNGVMLNPQDITSTNGTSITFDTALALSDEVDIVFHQPTASNLIRQDISDPMATESYVQTYVTNNSSAGATTAYANFAAFSNGTTEGDFAFAQDTKALYVWDGTEWDRVDSGDESPIILTEPPTTHSLNSDGTTSTMTMVAEDPEGFDVTYGIAYKTSGNTRPSQLSVDATVDANGVYTFTPSSTETDAGGFTARLSASDGAKTTTRFVDFTLSFDIELLLIAGGGGGNQDAGGGGGAGGFVENLAYTKSSGTYNIVVGTAGTRSTAQADRGGVGGDTTISYGGSVVYTAKGGGGGGPYPADAAATADGGSGGGAGRATGGDFGDSIQNSYGGIGFGNSGGTDYSNTGAGGGGGAGSAGGNGSDTVGGDGGQGKSSSITGSAVFYSPGGPGAGYNITLGSYVNGTASSYGAGGAGGKYGGSPISTDGAAGVCIIAGKSQAAAVTGGYTLDNSSRAGWYIYTFTSDGTITF